MNPSYFRIQVSKDEALRRFTSWSNSADIVPLVQVNISDSVKLACDKHGRWRGNAVFVSELRGWTLFQDLSGSLSGLHHDSWLKLAGTDHLVFAGYNDAIPDGELIVINEGSVKRVFYEQPDSPELNINIGSLSTDLEPQPFLSWVDIASFVDADELAFSDTGWLWVFRPNT